MNPTISETIGEAEIDAFQRDGAVCLRGLFDADWLALLRAETERALAAPGPFAEEYTKPGRPGRYFGDLDVWQRWEGFQRFAFHSPAAGIAGRLMQSDRVRFLYDQLLVKEPGTRENTPWHQDQPYWAVRGRQICSIWLPLDPVSRDSAVSFVAGSHSAGRMYGPHHFSDGTPYKGRNLPPLPDIDGDRSAHRLLGWDLEPGDCLVFHALTIHGSGGNSSLTQRRRALATRWTGDDVVYWHDGGEIAIPTSDVGLRNGDPLDGPIFPLVWQREE